MERQGRELFKTIQDGLNRIETDYLTVGMALSKFKAGEYWKKTHTTFGDFRDEIFGISERYSQYLMKAADAVLSLPDRLQLKVTNATQARAIADVPEKDRISAVDEAAKKGELTAKNILAAVSKNGHTPQKPKPPKPNNSSGSDPAPTESETPPKPPTPTKQKPEIILDKVGTPISQDALPFWNRREEVQGLLTQISRVRTKIKQARESEDSLYVRTSQNALDYLSRAYHVISDCKPYTLCTRCMGSPSMQKEGCPFCGSTGVISKIRWDNQSDPRVKQLRMLSNAEYAKSNNLKAPTEQPEESDLE